MTDKQLVRYARQFRRGLLGKASSHGRCFMVCAPLQGMLGADGIQTDLMLFDVKTPSIFTNHAILKLEDDRILDPTADQFPETGLPDVYLGQLPALYAEWCAAALIDSEANHRLWTLHKAGHA